MMPCAAALVLFCGCGTQTLSPMAFEAAEYFTGRAFGAASCSAEVALVNMTQGRAHAATRTPNPRACFIIQWICAKQAEEMVQPPVLPKPSPEDPTAQAIVVDNASFSWDASAAPILSNISLSARCGEGFVQQIQAVTGICSVLVALSAGVGVLLVQGMSTPCLQMATLLPGAGSCPWLSSEPVLHRLRMLAGETGCSDAENNEQCGTPWHSSS